MKKRRWISLVNLILTFFVASLLAYGGGGWAEEKLVLSTGSPYELGLIDALSNPFEAKYNCKIEVVKAGSGKALYLLREGKVDVILVHAPEAELKAVKEGWALHRTYIGANEFVIVGPKDDPAGIKGCDKVFCAYERIAEKKAVFLSRGDNSGTHKKEMLIWNKVGIVPEGGWYKKSKDFMMASLLKANKEGGYFMTDISTYIVAKKKHPDLKLVVLFRGDPLLVNKYHALIVNPERYPEANYRLAKKFVEFLKSKEGQKIIATYGEQKFGEPLYFCGSHKFLP
ncbi:MAG: ABC transporter substrate-binding protein [Deltaproteobacteria bacterium]|nr:MAG: ABC transporter substrate-binding protein [Deltaproteobacteria bacterium]